MARTRADPLAPPGQPACKPDNTTLAISDDTSCDVRDWNRPSICGRPGVLRAFYGCVNEHLGYTDVCPAHLATVSYTWSCRCGAIQKIIKTEKLGS